MAPYQLLKLELVETLGLSRDAFHIFLGFAVFLIFAFAARKQPWSWKLLLPPLIFAILLELLDARDAIAYGFEPDLSDSLRDILIAIVLPFFVLLLGRHRRGADIL